MKQFRFNSAELHCCRNRILGKSSKYLPLHYKWLTRRLTVRQETLFLRRVISIRLGVGFAIILASSIQYVLLQIADRLSKRIVDCVQIDL
jgi:hypothetical protein